MNYSTGTKNTRNLTHLFIEVCFYTIAYKQIIVLMLRLGSMCSQLQRAKRTEDKRYGERQVKGEEGMRGERVKRIQRR